MKKSVILIIIIVYIASIMIVGLAGIRMKVYNQKIYVQSITYQPMGTLNEEKTTEEKKYYEIGNLLEIVYTGSERAARGYDLYITDYIGATHVSYELKFRVSPDNVTDGRLEYLADSSDFYTVNGERCLDPNYVPKPEDVVSGFVILTKNEDGNAVLHFMAEGEFYFIVKPMDGSNKSYTVRILIQNNPYEGL